MASRPFAVNHALGLQPRGISLAHAGFAFDDFVHQWLRETGFVAFIMAKPPVAPHVDHNIAVEFLAEFNRHFTGESHRFWIIAIDVENRRLHAFGYVRWIG